MQYQTNQLDKKVLFSNENYWKIQQDFWIYKFTTTSNSYKYSIIDDIKQHITHVKAVLYLSGKDFFVLFEKNQYKNQDDLEGYLEEFVDDFNEKDEKEEVFYNKIMPSDIDEIVPHELAQLLFNSLANTSGRQKANKSNITGALYWVVKAIPSKKGFIWQYITLKIALDYHLHLKLDVKTFSSLKLTHTHKINFGSRKTKLKNLPQYEILPDNIRSMRRLKDAEKYKKPETTYILAQEDGKKSNIPYLEFSNYEKFKISKSGVLYEFLKEVKMQLDAYMTVSFLELPFTTQKTEFDKKLSKDIKKRVQTFYQDKPIVISLAQSLQKSDEISQKTTELAQNLQIFLSDKTRDYKANNVIIGELSEDALNIHIIRNKKYYANLHLEDEYCKEAKYLLHHITIDDFKVVLEKIKKITTQEIMTQTSKIMTSSPAIDVVLKEIYIKNDLKLGKISITNWTFGEWIFMSEEKYKEKNENKSRFKVLKVEANGLLSIEICEDNQLFTTADYQKLKEIYKTAKSNNGEILMHLLMFDNQDVNLIFETPLFTIQAIDKLGDALFLADENKEEKNLSKTQIIGFIDTFSLQLPTPQYPALKDKEKLSLDILKNILLAFNEDLSKIELLAKITEAKLPKNGNNHLQKRFCSFYREQTGDIIKNFFKSKKDSEELFAPNIYYQIESEFQASYFVGAIPAQIQTTFSNASNIRRIKAVKNLQGIQSKLVFDKLLETMNVDFVRNGNLTVLPFPFKYLREGRS